MQIIVNTLQSEYQRITNYRGTSGIGTPFTISTENPNEILVNSAVIDSKRSRLGQLRNGYATATIAQLRNNFGGGSGDNAEDRLIDAFKVRLRDILFPTNKPADPTTYFPYRRNFARIDDARDYIVEILDEWILLFYNISTLTTGYARVIQSPPTQVVVEESRSETFFGNITVNIKNVDIPISTALLSSSIELITSKTLQFFDKNREYKTVLSFGDDNQYLVEAWRTVNSDSASIQLKLVKPLQAGVSQYDSTYIVREFANPIIDRVLIELPAPVDDTLSLRPANMDVGKFAINKQSINDVTLTTLNLNKGFVGEVSASTLSYDDRVFNRWYTSDFNSSELNIDFSSYDNFVFFGSAEARLNAFANKLKKIQSYGDTISVSSSIESERKLAVERELIKRNFDLYEQYLYYASASTAYSSSAYYVDGGVEFNPTGSWPKTADMVPLPYASVESWYITQSAIAKRFDEYNPNYLVKHLPEHIQEDTNSEDFLKFVQIFGHVMDNIKVYIDQFSNIYATNPNPVTDLTMDQVYEVAKSFGLDLPNAYSLETLQSFISSLYDGDGARTFVAETWKRFLHSSVYLRKLKGSKTGVNAILNTYGLNSPIVQLKETSYATDNNYVQSDELVYALAFTGSVTSSVQIPFVSSSYSASTFQVRFIPTARRESTVLSSNGTWAVDIVPHPSTSVSYINPRENSIYTLTPPTVNYGKLRIVSGASRTVVGESTYFPLFSDVYTHLMLRSQSQDMVVVQTDGDQILHQQTASISLGTLWNSTRYVFLGGTGSIRINLFDGYVDDVRVWGENTTIDNFIKQVYDPGAYYGSTYSSSFNSLYVDISFSQPTPAISQSAVNESPFYDVSKLSSLPTQNITSQSLVRISRTIKQFTPVVGATAFSNKKTSVAPPPSFSEFFVDDNGTKTLSVNASIKSADSKKYTGGQTEVQFAISPTDFVNQTILRSMGDVDTNYLIGSPRKQTNDSYPELNDIFEFFLENYNETVNINQYIRFFSNVIKGPSEYVQDYLPAKAKLVDGIVIESPILHRNKTYIQKSIKVDGSNTVTFDNFVSGSGSADVGAYDFLAEYITESPENTTLIEKPILQKIGKYFVTSSIFNDGTGIGMVDGTVTLTGSVGPVSSTPPQQLPSTRKFTQYIGNYLVTSSIADDNSAVAYLDGEIESSARNFLTQSGYPRKAYEGLQYYNSFTYRIPSEVNTTEPFYEIKPIADFSDVGTTTYFNNSTGIYWFSLVQGMPKRLYKAKLNVPIGDIQSPAVREISNITLLSMSSITDLPGRDEALISEKTYDSLSRYTGVMNIANILSIYAIRGAQGIRLRLYGSAAAQTADLLRSVSVLPSVNSGVLFDGILSDEEVYPYLLLQTTNSLLYFTVDNLTTNPITTSIRIFHFKYQPTNLIPTGYLPRHYKFSRTNNIATLRRNYLGCKTVYCPEGCPPDVTDAISDSPVVIYETPRTEAVVRRPGFTDETGVFRFGGSGPLVE